jgi:FkbM family methyltransferase
MVNLELIQRMLKTTKNFWQVPFLKFSPRKRKINFRNGATMELDLAGYRNFRDLFYTLNLKKFKVTKNSEEFVISKKQPFFNCLVPSLETLLFFDFLISLTDQNWNVRQVDEKTFKIDRKQESFELKRLDDQLFAAKSEGVSFIGPVESLMVYFLDCLRGFYDCDYKGKSVLDIGGFYGETAVYFANQGAKKVIIYEPVKMHYKIIRKNMALNAVNLEFHEEGMGAKNGQLCINYDVAGLGFGLTNKGENTLTIDIKSATNIISQSQADIAKIDCEGAEITLVDVPRDILRLIEFYIIEAHTKAIQEAITKKFLEAGFIENRVPERLSGEVYMVYFRKI